ncbi:hypothetical protein NC653_041246 [Populus alba x Populus x berolinensis]|uniref:Uncharacterized protein n=1 Tax=Populus alba x Populus x berolinensis TaxID=444605 RepID=A0AAD6PNR7_9ROSI|nr:hypothetical protein NC653_041246 [Populus alba x Populus x berolinensis]
MNKKKSFGYVWWWLKRNRCGVSAMNSEIKSGGGMVGGGECVGGGGCKTRGNSRSMLVYSETQSLRISCDGFTLGTYQETLMPMWLSSSMLVYDLDGGYCRFTIYVTSSLLTASGSSLVNRSSLGVLILGHIMCTTSKRDVGLARSLNYLSLKEHIQPQKPYVSMQLEYSCSSILLNFLSLQSWIGFQLELAL